MPPKKLKIPEESTLETLKTHEESKPKKLKIPDEVNGRKKRLITPKLIKEDKNKDLKKTLVIEDVSGQIEMSESNEEPIVVTKMVIMKLFSHDGKKYYMDSENHSLYAYAGHKKKGAYIGRWDALRSCIVSDAPESECEE